MTAGTDRGGTLRQDGAPRWRSMRQGLLAAAVVAAACAPSRVIPVARGCPAGPVPQIVSQGDVARLAGCTTVTSLVVRTGAALDLSPLAALSVITGDLVIGPTVAIESVSLGALRRVGGAVRVTSNGSLQGLYLPQLADAGAIEIAGNAVIATISLPRLASVHGALQVADDPALEVLDLSALVAVDRALVVTGVPALALVEAPRLARAAAVELDAPRLAAELARSLRAAVPAR